MALAVLISAGCGSGKEAVDIRKGAVSSSSETPQSERSISQGQEQPAGSPGVGRRLDEAGSVKRDHPAGGMERPEKWKQEARPTFADVSKANGYPPLEFEELSSLGEIGMREAKIFVVASPPQDFLGAYTGAEAGARIVEKGRMKSITMPVREGLMLVTASEHSDGKTLITELLLPRETGSVNLDVLDSLRERVNQSR